MLGSLGIPELLFIFGLALLVFGPKRLPEVGRALGRGMAELRKASNDLKRTINAEMIEQEMREHDPRRMVRDSLRDVKDSLTVDLSEPAPKPDSAPTAADDAKSGGAGSSTAGELSEPARSVEGSVARGAGGPDADSAGTGPSGADAPGLEAADGPTTKQGGDPS